MTVKIVTDSTADIPEGICHELGITVVPLSVHFGKMVYENGVDITNEDFYQKLQESDVFPTTSTKSPGYFTSVYQKLAGEGDPVISIHVSENFSATIESARLGRQNSGIPVEIVDSESASMGLGLLTIMAAGAAADGATVEDIKSLLSEAIPNTLVLGLFETIAYLQKGGRIGKARAFIGSLLKIKPIIAIQHGAIVPIQRARSKSRGIDLLCNLVNEFGVPRELATMYTNIPSDADELIKQLKGNYPEQVIYSASIGPVIGSHVGPGSVGVSVVRL
ncbi:MAG: DegV family protein [Dehalococcoidia bacterium]